MGLKLGYHYHVPALGDPNGIYMPGYQGRFLDSLAAHCEQVVCFLHSPLPGEMPLMDYRIQSPNVTLVDIGPHVSVPRRLLGAWRSGRAVREWHQRLDVMFIRGPTPLIDSLAEAAAGVPLVLLLVGDQLAGIDDMAQPWWRKEAIRLMWRWNYRQQLRLARRSLVFVNSRRLYEQLRPSVPHLYETRTTTLTEKDFFYREDTCQKPPYRLLYTGRMARQKGLLEMVEALAILVAQGEDVILDLVGWPEKNEDILNELQALAQAKGIPERVRYHGFKAVGPELFAYYQQADIYVVASYSDFEGFPRAIWEAMAHSLPVVATRVGSIPHFLRDGENALLVKPHDPIDLSEKLRRLIGEPFERKKLIRCGLEMARKITLEKQTAEMVGIIEEKIRKINHI